MTLTAPETPSRIHYSPQMIARADRAVRCTPFQLQLFVTMRWQSVELKAIPGTLGVNYGYTKYPISERTAESRLTWLIQVGLLRREVDGQGLTDSFRLTPLGHQLVQRWQNHTALPPASWSDYLYNALNHWVRLPSWLQS